MKYLDLESDVNFKTALDEKFNQGMAKGIEEGMEIGEAKGIEKGVVLTASKLKAAGADINLIMQCTGLSEADINKL